MRHVCAVLIIVAMPACDRAATGLAFRKRVIDPAFRSEGVTVFDVDRDGHLDLVTEELWYAGPDFTPHEIRDPRTYDPLTGYASCFGAFHSDVDGDGFDDLIVFHFPGTSVSWCRNPARDDRHWDCHDIAASAIGESPALVEGLGDRASLLGVVGPAPVLGWLTPAATPDLPWDLHPVTPVDFAQAGTFNHGLGTGDVDGDGRVDLVTGVGWFSRPDNPSGSWVFHPVEFCPGNCSHMFVDDVNGDGLPDVIGASPHNYGTWWWEHTAGEFVRHEIDSSISQNHAARYVDLDGDGVSELVTGKRYWAHLDHDAGAYDPVLLVVYRHRLVAGEVVWSRIELDDDSGVGSHQIEVIDVDGDSRLDIVVSNKKGLFLFQQE